MMNRLGKLASSRIGTLHMKGMESNRTFAGLSYITKLKKKKQLKMLKPDMFVSRGGNQEEEYLKTMLPSGKFVRSPQHRLLGKNEIAPAAGIKEGTQILEDSPIDQALDTAAFRRIHRLLRRHPFYHEWVPGTEEIHVNSILVKERYSFGKKRKCFCLCLSDGNQIEMGLRYTSKSRKSNLEKLFMDACSSSIETSKFKELVRDRLRDQNLVMNLPLVCRDFAVEMDIQIYNPEHLLKVVYRNSLGYWHFTRPDVKEEFLKFYVKSLYKSKYTTKRGEKTQSLFQAPVQVSVRPSSSQDSNRIRDVLNPKNL